MLFAADSAVLSNCENQQMGTGILAQKELRHRHPAFVVAPQTDLSWIVSGSVPEVTEAMLEQYPSFFRDMIEIRGALRERVNKGHLQVVFALLDALAEEFDIDTDRVYVLGWISPAITFSN